MGMRVPTQAAGEAGAQSMFDSFLSSKELVAAQAHRLGTEDDGAMV